MISFSKANFGKCEVISLLKEVAIIELEKSVEKYVVVTGFNYKEKRWNQGYYCKTLKDASEIFNTIVEDYYMAIFKI